MINLTLSKLDQLMRMRGNPLAQLVKYVACGGVAILVDTLTFYLLAWLVFPCLRLTDPIAQILTWMGASISEVSDLELQRNYWIIKCISFILSNAVVYILNILYVFEAGRHRKPMEIFLFYFFSLFQFVFIGIGSVLISQFNWEVTYSNIAMLFLGLIVNYIVKKYIVFKG